MRTTGFTPTPRRRRTATAEAGAQRSGRGWQYYDADGHGPFRRFLKADDPHAMYPTRRIVMFLFLGSCLSTVGVQLSADEYYEGPQQHRLTQHQLEGTRGFPVHIAFRDVGCKVAGLPNPVISNITGEIRPGKVTGILGQSGSGKTTFALSLLGRGKRYCTGGASGSVFLNGRPRDLEAFLDRVGFVPQDDVLYPELTVEEALTFSASWRLPRDMTQHEKQQVVEDALRTLDLDKVRDRRIGSVQQRSISGGERKRASIGMELVSLPAVLVMDEPTSGLDSAGTFQLMSMLRSVARRGVSVVTVIHQPSARVFNLLDDLILMQDGEAAFIGPREDALPFLADMGYAVPQAAGDASSLCGTPSAEFILDVLANLEEPSHAPTLARVEDLCEETGAAGCLSPQDHRWHPLLPTFFRHRAAQRGVWRGVEAKMQDERREEDVLRCVTQRAESEFAAVKPLLDNRTALKAQVARFRADCERQEQATSAGAFGENAQCEGDASGDAKEDAGADAGAREDIGANGSAQCAAAAPRRRADKKEKRRGWGVVAATLEWLGVAACAKGDARMWCTVFDTREAFPSYQQLPKPGFKRQVGLWFNQIMGLKWRRGLAAEVSVIASLALVVSFVRSFNQSWNRRAVSNLFLSISIGLLGMVGAVFHDDIAPVQRAASAGMLLGAHEFAVLAESIVWGWCVSHIYSSVYFMGLWVRSGMWIIDVPSSAGADAHLLDLTHWVRLQKYYEFAHMLHLNYLASGALGNAICVFANHDTSTSYVISVALLITCHVFAFFTPNQHQVRQEATVFGCLNIGPAVEVICSLSYVRYFLEAIFLWDPSPADPNGRSYVLRYFGYVDANKTHCATSLFSLWTIAQAIRFLVFGFRNSNDFHSLYDTPLFLIFIFKVLSCHIVALLIMTLIQEWYFPWLASLQERVKTATEEHVDILGLAPSERSQRAFPVQTAID